MSAPTAIYTRISQVRDDGADGSPDDLGVTRQRADCEALADRLGLSLAEIYTDNDRSASNGKPRPAWSAMLGEIRAGRIGTVVAWANDRLYRRVRDQLELMEAVAAAGVRIVTVKDGEADPATASGQMLMGILANVAAFETTRKSERQRAKAREIAAHGKPNGGGMRPYGYDEGGMAVRDDEADVIREAAARVIAGESTYEIARDLNARGITTSHGAAWSHRNLARTLRLPRIAGLRAHGDELHPATWPAIVNRRTWDAVRRRLAVRTPGRRGTRRTYLLTGLITCGRCGEPMRGHPIHGKRSYACLTESGGCGDMRIIAEPTEDVVAEAVFAAVDSGVVTRAAAADAQAQGLGAQIEADRAALEDLSRDRYVDRSITPEEYHAAREPLAERIHAAERALARREDTAVLVGMTSGAVARARWEDEGTPWRRELLRAVLARVVIAPATGRRFEESRIECVWAV